MRPLARAELQGQPPGQKEASAAEDEAWLLAAGQGDRDAFRRLVVKHGARMQGYAEKMTGSRQQAEDIVQVACLRMWQHAPGWTPDAKCTTWMYRILTNLCIDYRRSLRHRYDTDEDALAALPSDEPAAEQRLIEAQRAAAVRAQIAALPSRQRAALVLCYYEECSQKQAAAILEVTEKALESLLVRARRQLRTQLQPILWLQQ